jgi:ABC-2 type transport system ATP-binding protein
LPEGAPLYGDMTVYDFLDFIAAARGIERNARRSGIDAMVSRVHLEGVIDQRIDTLSKGFKRRVGIAQAVIHDPEVLILDEPTDGLDPNQKHEMRSFITTLAAAGKAILISTHLLEEVETTCSRVLLIDSGTVKLDGTPADLKAQASDGTLDDAFRRLTAS